MKNVGQGVSQITIQFPRNIFLPNGFYQQLSENLSLVLKDDYPNMWVAGEGFAMSNPFLEQIKFDESHYVFEVKEK